MKNIETYSDWEKSGFKQAIVIDNFQKEIIINGPCGNYITIHKRNLPNLILALQDQDYILKPDQEDEE